VKVVTDTTRSPCAIIVVDPQPDFFEGGSLPIPGATAASYRIAAFLHERHADFDLTIVTQDWHLNPGDHWSSEPDFVSTWPVHCAANTLGAEIHESLADVHWDAVIHKGMHEAAFSGFDGEGFDGATLNEVLSSSNIHNVTVVGFATDYCVRATALDARALGMNVRVKLDLCAGVDPATTASAIAEMLSVGIEVEA
jgi:nicotinamidase/pyrazinamidase